MSSLQVLSVSLMIHFLINGPVSSKGEPSMNIYDHFFHVTLPQLLFSFILWGQHKQHASTRSSDWCSRLQLLSDRFSSADKRFWPKRRVLRISQGLKDIRQSANEWKPRSVSVCCCFHVPPDVHGRGLPPCRLLWWQQIKRKVWLPLLGRCHQFWISTDFIVVDTWGYGYHP